MRNYCLKSGSALVIRELDASDAPAVEGYLKKIAGQSDYLTFSPDEVQSPGEIRQYLSSGSRADNCLVVAALMDEQIAGMLSFTGGPKSRVRHTGEFGVSVLKEYWGLGIATALITYMLDWARHSRIVRKIKLRVRSDHQAALRLYSDLGFIPEGEVSREFCVNGQFYSALLMGREID